MSVLIEKNGKAQPRTVPIKSRNEKLKILILEDFEPDAELFLRELKKGGIKFMAVRVDNFKKFAFELERFKPSIILADYSLPAYSGIDALEYIKKNKINIPFIFVTGSQSDEVAVECLKAGADDYILKSNLSRLPAAVTNILEKRLKEHAKTKAEIKFLQYQSLCENLLLIQSQLDIGFLVVDNSNLQILYVNKAFCTMCGYNVGEIFNLPSFEKLIAQDKVIKFQNQLEKILKNINSVTIFNTELVKKDQQLINIELTAKLLPESKDNNLSLEKRIIFIARDMTGHIGKELMQQLTLEALRESEKRFRSLIDDVKDYAIFMLDSEKRIISWNLGAERVMGYSEEEIILKDMSIFSSSESEDDKLVLNLISTASEKGRLEKELWLQKKGKQKLWAAVTITTLFNENSEPNGFSIIIRDLTKNKIISDQLREQETQLRSLAAHLQAAREEERTRIARELHDEFSQMLTALRMDLTLLGRSITKTVAEPLNRMTLLEKISSISELLETTIKSTRRIITELRPAVLDELGLMTAIQWQAQEFENRTGIRCKIERLQHEIVLDQNTSTAIFRIFQEALTNVAKHASANAVSVSLQIINQKMILDISDNGKGMDDDQLKDPTSSGILGIRERVIALGGQFEIFSGKEQGTKVIVSIPYQND